MDRTRLLDEEPRTIPARVVSGEKISAPTHQEIAERAYHYWEARGGDAGGSPLKDWLRAEQELKERRR